MRLVLLPVYILILALFIFVLLFGQSAQFEGTVVQKAHWFITEGLCSCTGSVVVKVGGKRGQRMLDLFGEYYCDRPNPTLQIFYLGLVTSGYLIFVNYSFDRLPGPFLSTIHWYTGPLAVLLSLGVFFLASFSDPGTITAANVDRHLLAYPYDNVMYVPKLCRTMRIPAPARSKFDGITNRRVARFDHFCSWMNNAIGENNYRYFLSFLILHVFLFVYAAAFFVAIVAGEVVRRGALDVPFPGPDGEHVWLRDRKRLLLQWVLYHFPAETMLAGFVCFTTLLVGGFLAYHLTLISRGTTTYESFKWRDLRRELLERAAEDAARERDERAAAQGGAQGGAAAGEGEEEGEEGRGGGGAWGRVVARVCPGFLRRLLRGGEDERGRRRRRRRRGSAALAALVSKEDREEIERLCANSYRVGLWAGLGEVFFPRSGRAEVVRAAEEARRAREGRLAAAAEAAAAAADRGGGRRRRTEEAGGDADDGAPGQGGAEKGSSRRRKPQQ